MIDDPFDGIDRKLNSLGPGRLHERLARIHLRQRPDLGVIKEPLRV